MSEKNIKINSRSGFSIVGAVVATVLIAMGVVLLAQLMTDQKVSEKRLDHRVSGEQVLVDTATFYQNGEFDAIWGLCETKLAFAGEVTGICVVSGGINNAAAVQPVPSTDPSTDPRVLEVLRGWDGLPQTNGPLCVELTRCFARAEGRLLEARFTGFWVDPKAGMKVAQKQIILRRTRW